MLGLSLDISCHDPGGFCGRFCYNIFPSLCTFQFGGSLPWWPGDSPEPRCPKPHNQVILRLERFPRG